MSTVPSAKVTFFNTRALPTLMARNDGSPKLSDRQTYEQAWKIAAKGQKWGHPWRKDTSFSNVWAGTLATPRYSRAAPNAAFSTLAPLLDLETKQAECVIDGVACSMRRFISPLGVAVELRCSITNAAQTPDDLLAIVDQLARGETLRMAGSPDALTLKSFMSQQLTDLEREFRPGQQDDAFTSRFDPVRVSGCTFVSGWDPGPPTDGDALHRLLHGLCGRRPTETANPTPLAELVLDGDDSTLRAYTSDGCAIFAPDADDSSRRKGIECYIDNVSTALMRTQLSMNALEWAADEAAVGEGPRRLVDRAATEIKKSRLGWDDTYRSEFLRKYIDDNLSSGARAFAKLEPLPD